MGGPRKYLLPPPDHIASARGGFQPDPKFLSKINEKCYGFLGGFWEAQAQFREPFWFHFGLQNPTHFWIDFSIDFLLILASCCIGFLMIFGIVFYQISNSAEFKKMRFRMEGIATIKVEDPQKASKILTESHRKWDRKNQ